MFPVFDVKEESVLRARNNPRLVTRISGFRQLLARIPLLGWLFPFPVSQLGVSILRFDSNPAPTNSEIWVFYRLTNYTNTNITVHVKGSTDEGTKVSKPAPVYLAPQAEYFGTLKKVFYYTPGQHIFTLDASTPSGSVTISISIGDVITVTPVDNLPVSDEGSIQILAPGKPDRPSFTDISPNESNGTANAVPSAGGVMGALAGTEKTLYAVGKTSGVWSSSNGGTWQQCNNSPEHAFCIAVSRLDPNNVLVGERDGDSVDPHFDQCGLWESSDAGNTWDFIYDPFPDSGAHRIRTVAYARLTGTLFAATETGLVRRTSLDVPTYSVATLDLPTSASGFGPVTALAVSETKIWARTASTLLVSSNDGVTWAAIPIPVAIVLYGYGAVNVRLDTTGPAGGSDLNSLAAFDAKAFIVFKPYDGKGNDPTSNLCTLLIYDVASNAWQGQVLTAGDGRGLGGRRFVKSFVLDCPTLSASIGDQLQLFFGAGEDIFQATGENPDGTIQWSDALGSSGSTGSYNTDIHADFWDFHIGLDYCPPKNITAWLATDGGIFKAVLGSTGIGTRPNPDFNGLITQMQWVTANDGLHTHNIHDTLVIPQPEWQQSVIAYSTQDNDGWWRKPNGQWQREAVLGDVDSAQGDAGNSNCALLTRGFYQGQSVLTSFGDDQNPTAFTISRVLQKNESPDSTPPDTLRLRFIQTLAGEPDYPLDAVMLTRLPLHDGAGNALPNPVGVGAAREVILRNQNFADSPDGPNTSFREWTVEESALPTVSIQDFWVTGGHVNPMYYVLGTDPVNGNALYKRLGPGNWITVLTGLMNGGHHGPVFVNPYDSTWLLAIAKDATHPLGVVMACTDGYSFAPDEALTALVTESGRFPLGTIDPNNQLSQIGSRFH